MSITQSLIDKVVQRKADLEAWKRDHPEMAEGIDLLDSYLEAYDELYRQCSSYQIYGYPVYPSYPSTPWWQSRWITTTRQLNVGDGSITTSSSSSMEGLS